MLKPAWYLPDTDWYRQLPDTAGLDDDTQALLGLAATLFGHDSGYGPAKTIAATAVILVAAEHLGEAMTIFAGQHDLAEVTRLICGLNLLQAHLAQTLENIATNLDVRGFDGLASVPTEVMRPLVDTLVSACTDAEMVAGQLKDAHLALRTAAR